MYVCICNAITDKQIRRAAADGASSVYDLQSKLGVATCCGGCADHAGEILSESQRTRAPMKPVMYVPSPA